MAQEIVFGGTYVSACSSDFSLYIDTLYTQHIARIMYIAPLGVVYTFYQIVSRAIVKNV